jgi:hypothetical protein
VVKSELVPQSGAQVLVLHDTACPVYIQHLEAFAEIQFVVLTVLALSHHRAEGLEVETLISWISLMGSAPANLRRRAMRGWHPGACVGQSKGSPLFLPMKRQRRRESTTPSPLKASGCSGNTASLEDYPYDYRYLSSSSFRFVRRDAHSMKRRTGAGSSSGAEEPRSKVVTADTDDKELSEAAKQRIAEKAKREAAGGSGSAATQPLPLGLILVAVAVVAAMLYVTLRYS